MPGKRFFLDDEFRAKLFEIAAKIEGGDAPLGKQLGYAINYGYRVRQLKRGEVTLRLDQLEKLSGITGISMNEIMKFAKPKTKIKQSRK